MKELSKEQMINTEETEIDLYQDAKKVYEKYPDVDLMNPTNDADLTTAYIEVITAALPDLSLSDLKFILAYIRA